MSVRSRGRALAPVALVLVVSSLSLSSCAVRHYITYKPAHPAPAGSTTVSTLPPSHDNDAGGARAPDPYLDADVDAWQRTTK